jgi:hypothetical protein
MIDFSKFDIEGYYKFLSTVPTSVDNGERFEIGMIIEFALETFSNGQLRRINEDGRDLIDNDGFTYESKKISFANKSGMAVRGVILRNGMSSSFNLNYNPADFYLFTDTRKLRCACVTGDMIYDLKSTPSWMTGKCDPQREHFFLWGDEDFSPATQNYLKEKQDFLRKYIQQFKTNS